MRTYTFHVSLPEDKAIWRKIELPADATLEGLHVAIQEAYAFDNAHLYSFFMSGQAWDERSEFTLPEDTDLWEGMLPLDTEDEAAAYADEHEADNATSLHSDLAEEIEAPTAAELRALLEFLQNDPQARQQFTDTISQEVGMPPAMIDKLINDMQTVAQGMSDDQMDGLLQVADPFATDDDIDEDEDEVGDVRTTALDALQLHEGQRFLYLFDYGDEWQFNVSVHAINPNADPTVQYPRVVESVGAAPEQYADWEERNEME